VLPVVVLFFSLHFVARQTNVYLPENKPKSLKRLRGFGLIFIAKTKKVSKKEYFVSDCHVEQSERFFDIPNSG